MLSVLVCLSFIARLSCTCPDVNAGYKLREAIGKGLKSRSQAIRTAVARYNELAAELDPPAPPVNFSILMEWTELQEFELLRHSRAGDVLDKAWAQPANRLMAVKHYKLARAEEELIHCRIETRRLVTAMRDEEQHFDHVQQALHLSNVVLSHELAEYIAQRRATNETHRARLCRLTEFEGFGAAFVPGTCTGAVPIEATVVDADAAPRAVKEGDANEREEVDDLNDSDTEVQEDLHRLHDYLAAVE